MEITYEHLKSADKCVVSGNVVWNKIIEDYCFNILETYIKWEWWDYIVNALYVINSLNTCTYDGFNKLYDAKSYPKSWDYFSFLVIKNQSNYENIWWIENVWEWKYSIDNIEFEETFSSCEPNYKFTWEEVFTTDYFCLPWNCPIVWGEIIEEEIESWKNIIYDTRIIILCTILIIILIYIIWKNIFRKTKG
jgi:hypothetical protein